MRLVLSTDTGDLTCWVKLRIPANVRIPANAPSFSAKLSTGAHLWVYQDTRDGSDQWIAIVAEGQKPQEKFKWPSGAALSVYSSNNSPGSLTLNDWRVFLSDKDYDSKDRAKWRTWVFRGSVALLILALIGGGLEGLERYSKLTEEVPPFTSQRCIEELIKSTEGATPQETKWMRAILTKVLLRTVSVADALAPLPLEDLQRKRLWFKTRDQFRRGLERLILESNNYLSYLL